MDSEKNQRGLEALAGEEVPPLPAKASSPARGSTGDSSGLEAFDSSGLEALAGEVPLLHPNRIGRNTWFILFRQ